MERDPGCGTARGSLGKGAKFQRGERGTETQKGEETHKKNRSPDPGELEAGGVSAGVSVGLREAVGS